MFGSRRIEAVLAALRAENSDLRTQIRLERVEAAEQQKLLLDRILALTNPGAARLVARATADPTQEPSKPSPESKPRRLHYPGYAAHTRPPSPVRTSTAPDSSPDEPDFPDTGTSE